MRVAITGGAGFIGSHLAERLIDAEHQVFVLDDLSTGQAENVARGALLARMDIASPGAADALTVQEPDVIVHAAASYANPLAWERDVLVNTYGMLHVIEAARTVNARVVYFQTALCYGTNPAVSPIPLDAPLRPDSSYAISKTAAELYLMNAELDFVSLRLANVYGPRNLSGPVPAFYKRLAAGEPCWVADTRRDFIYIDDLLEVVDAVVVDGRGRGVYHVASGRDVAIADLFTAIVDALGIEASAAVQPRDGRDAPTILLDPTRLQQEFDWKASTPLEVGVKKACAWYRDHGVGETYTHLPVG